MNYTKLILEACKNSLNQSGSQFFNKDEVKNEVNEDILKKIFDCFDVFVGRFNYTFEDMYLETAKEEGISKSDRNRVIRFAEKVYDELEKLGDKFYSDKNLENLANYFDKFLELWDIPHDMDPVFDAAFMDEFYDVKKNIKEFQDCDNSDDVFAKINKKIKELKNGEFNFEI